MKTNTVNFKPILFSTAMIQALLSGSKTQTRRSQGLEKINASPELFRFDGIDSDSSLYYFEKIDVNKEPLEKYDGVKSRISIGDVLWVRETFQQEVESIKNDFGTGYMSTGKYVYRADGIDLELDSVAFGKWKPSIFMPKEACRLFLKVKSVRVERLCDISESDAIAEGIEVLGYDEGTVYRDYIHDHSETNDPQLSFETLWYKINGRESWNDNPWVWVIEFERIERPAGFL